MIRILFGPDVKDYAALEKELDELKRLYEVVDEKRRAAEHGQLVARAEHEELAQYCDGLNEQLRDARADIERMHRRWNRAVDAGFVDGDAVTEPVKTAGSLQGLGSAFGGAS